MKKVTLRELQARVRTRKARLGISEDTAAVEAMRNKGGARTDAKRELLGRAGERARVAGKAPTKSYY